MPSYSGVWTLSQQFQGRGQGLWPATPGAPTIGTATAGAAACASVTFTAPTCVGGPGAPTYTATSTPSCITGTGAASPIVVSGLTTGTSYTFRVKAQTGGGVSPCSAASNSVTPVSQGQTAYTTAGTYSYVVPAGTTSISVVTVGAGGSGGATIGTNSRGGGGGGALAYTNNISTTPGETLTVTVGAGGCASGGDGITGGQSALQRSATYLARAGGGVGGKAPACGATPGGTVLTGTGGAGGAGGAGATSAGTGGGGAGGYSGAGGAGSSNTCGFSAAACSGGGGGGGAGNTTTRGGGGGGGVGILGLGATGTGGTTQGGGGVGGSGGANGSTATSDAGAPGGAYGGGGGGANDDCNIGLSGAVGAVRIIYPGTARSFPSTNTGNL